LLLQIASATAGRPAAGAIWLRDATNADLDAYLSHHEAFALARQQQAERMPLSAVHTLLGPVLKGDPNDRPYAHPYYWAPFVFYGAEADGQSLPHEQAAAAFENLGNSNKISRTLETGERLHGRRGEGRHKSLSLGRNVEWRFTYAHDGRRSTYQIVGSAGREDPFFLTDPEPAADGEQVGCTVTISEIDKSLHRLLYPKARYELAAQFAPFLLRYSDRRLSFHGHKIEPRDVIAQQRRLRAFTVRHAGNLFRVTIEVIHWKPGQTRKEVLLCSENGIPLHQIDDRTISSSSEYSAFVRSALFDRLHEENLLQSIEMSGDPERSEAVNKIRTTLRKYFRKLQLTQADQTLIRLKTEGSYPYHHDPQTDIDKVERRVFDVCAINISRHLPNFTEGMDVQGRKLLLRMVQESLALNPSSVGKIIREVCRLPERDAKTFARLLDDVPLGNVVQAASMVSERLTFLKFFEAVIYLNPFDRLIKERTELHRILAMNTWLFGEEYAVGTDDENLKAVLESHVEILGRNHLQPEIREADLKVLLTEFNRTRELTEISLDRIPDLMLWRNYRERRPDEYEFLVIKIKRPGVPLGRKEIAQIEDYADAVTSTPFADSDRTRWVFVLVSDTLDKYADGRAHQDSMAAYTISKPAGARYEIRAYPWSVVIRSAKARHEHLRQWLNHNVTLERAMETASAAYDEYLPPPKNAAAETPKTAQRGGGKRRRRTA
jgi:hypothetical protein